MVELAGDLTSNRIETDLPQGLGLVSTLLVARVL